MSSIVDKIGKEAKTIDDREVRNVRKLYNFNENFTFFILRITREGIKKKNSIETFFLKNHQQSIGIKMYQYFWRAQYNDEIDVLKNQFFKKDWTDLLENLFAYSLYSSMRVLEYFCKNFSE